MWPFIIGCHHHCKRYAPVAGIPRNVGGVILCEVYNMSTQIYFSLNISTYTYHRIWPTFVGKIPDVTCDELLHFCIVDSLLLNQSDNHYTFSLFQPISHCLHVQERHVTRLSCIYFTTVVNELNHGLWYGRMIMQLIPTVIVPLRPQWLSLSCRWALRQ